MNGLMDGLMGGRMDGWMDGWVGEWMDRLVGEWLECVCTHLYEGGQPSLRRRQIKSEKNF